WQGRCSRLARDADQVPAHAAAVVGYFHGGEDVRAERLIGLFDDDRHVEERHEALANKNLLFLAADEYRDLSAALGRLVGGLGRRRHRLRRIVGGRRLDRLGLWRPVGWVVFREGHLEPPAFADG